MSTQAVAAPKNDVEWIIALDRAESKVWPAMGGKGARLAEMLQNGLRVPPGVCLTTSAFEHFLDATGLRAKVAEAGAGATVEEYAAAREAVLSTPVPPALRDVIIEAYAAMGRPRVAVRSSAVGEDSGSHSFAGQHDTLLDLQGDDAVIDAVRACWASLWSERARSYRTTEREHSQQSIAVVIQELVDAEAAGVLFTVDPVSGDQSKMILEACFGLGEGLVAGRVVSDSYVIDRRTLQIDRQTIRYKVTRCVATGDGNTMLEKVPAELRDAPTLTEEQVGDLARQALDLIGFYGTEQDIEWATREGLIYILQSRPITTKSEQRRATTMSPNPSEPDPHIKANTLWSRMDIGEIFNGIMTPLGISFARYYQFNVHADCARSVGSLDLGDPNRYMGYMQGHVYLNVDYTAYLLSQSPPTRDQHRFTARFSSEEVDLPSHVNPHGVYPGGREFLRTSVYFVRAQLRELATMQARAREMVTSRYAEYDRAIALDLPSLDLPALSAEIRRNLEYFRRMHAGYMPFYINAFGFYGALEAMCKNWLGDEGSMLQNRLKSDMSNLRTVESINDIVQLVNKCRARPEVRRLICEGNLDDVLGNLKAHPEGQAFLQREFAEFLRNNGVRGRQEMEISNPRWVDDPIYIFQMMRKYFEHDIVMDDVLRRGSEHRTVDTEAILRKLPLQRRALLKGIIKLYSLCSELREATRMSMVTSIWIVRRIVYELGRRLVAQGILRSLDEVAFLDFFDVLAVLDGAPAAAVFTRDALEASRREHLYNLRLPEPPLTFVGTYDPSEAIARTGGSVIEGLGTSPGRVVGRARLVHDLVRQADEFEPGDILVTSFTDAAWTPLFLLASAVVTDIGSMLSHSSIVAREFNIPSVVNTKVATRSIRTGDILIVDGDRGVVEVQRSEET
ncbi:MAG: hypothetical protein KC620_08655 [Myxococcales bacterium]|nr:hypothetical protein [Myxococcales bacterium]